MEKLGFLDKTYFSALWADLGTFFVLFPVRIFQKVEFLIDFLSLQKKCVDEFGIFKMSLTCSDYPYLVVVTLDGDKNLLECLGFDDPVHELDAEAAAEGNHLHRPQNDEEIFLQDVIIMCTQAFIQKLNITKLTWDSSQKKTHLKADYLLEDI